MFDWQEGGLVDREGSADRTPCRSPPWQMARSEDEIQDRDPIGEGLADPRGISTGEIHAANLTCFRVRIACSFHPKWVISRCRLPDLQHVPMGNGQPADIPISGLNSKDLMSFTLYLYMVIPDFSQNRGFRAGPRVREGGSVRPDDTLSASHRKREHGGSKGSLSARTPPYVAGNDLYVHRSGIFPIFHPRLIFQER